MTPRAAVVAMALLGSVFVAACVPGTAAGGADSAVELTVYAASSLKEVLTEVERAYEAETPRTTLTLATDASSTLRAQIEQGAPADVFLAADQANPRALLDAGLADGQAVDFAGNRLTIIVPTDNPAGIATPADLARPGIKIVAAGNEVPITGYVQQLVTNLAELPGYPADFAEAYGANVVTREEDVKAVVAKIELGEGDAAVVYATDAGAAADVMEIEIPPAANVTAIYAGVVVKGSRYPNDGRAFLTWLASPKAAEVLVRSGFRPPE